MAWPHQKPNSIRQRKASRNNKERLRYELLAASFMQKTRNRFAASSSSSSKARERRKNRKRYQLSKKFPTQRRRGGNRSNNTAKEAKRKGTHRQIGQVIGEVGNVLENVARVPADDLGRRRLPLRAHPPAVRPHPREAPVARRRERRAEIEVVGFPVPAARFNWNVVHDRSIRQRPHADRNEWSENEVKKRRRRNRSSKNDSRKRCWCCSCLGRWLTGGVIFIRKEEEIDRGSQLPLSLLLLLFVRFFSSLLPFYFPFCGLRFWRSFDCDGEEHTKEVAQAEHNWAVEVGLGFGSYNDNATVCSTVLMWNFVFFFF